MTSVGEDFPRQQERVRHLIDDYRALPNGAGVIGAIMLDDVLRRAAEAQSSGDVVQVVKMYYELANCE